MTRMAGSSPGRATTRIKGLGSPACGGGLRRRRHLRPSESRIPWRAQPEPAVQADSAAPQRSDAPREAPVQGHGAGHGALTRGHGLRAREPEGLAWRGRALIDGEVDGLRGGDVERGGENARRGFLAQMVICINLRERCSI